MRKLLFAALLMLSPMAVAQTSTELLVASSLAAALDPGVKLPGGTYGYSSAKTAQDFSKSLGADASKYTDYQLYVATGILSKGVGAFLQQLETNFALAGYFKAATSKTETTTRSEYTNDAGKTLLLFTSFQKDAVFFLVGRKK